jgi:monothiol glutaredoxin
MMRFIVKPSAFRLPVQRSVRYSARFFSDDSHDDFKPKKKDAVEDMKEVLELIDKQVKEHPLLLFMKGTPSKPQCGFSLQVVRILNAVGADFSSINVLEYPAIREGIKKYSDWPTIPQVYVNGEFIGGCDIVTSMYKEGELETMLKEKKLIKE